MSPTLSYPTIARLDSLSSAPSPVLSSAPSNVLFCPHRFKPPPPANRVLPPPPPPAADGGSFGPALSLSAASVLQPAGGAGGGAANQYAYAGLLPDTAYVFAVAFRSPLGPGPPGPASPAGLTLPPPAPPPAALAGVSAIVAAWAASPRYTAYRVDLAAWDSAAAAFGPWTSQLAGAGAASVSFAGLGTDAIYQLRMAFQNPAGWGPSGPVVPSRTTLTPVPLQPPPNDLASPTPTSIVLRWIVRSPPPPALLPSRPPAPRPVPWPDALATPRLGLLLHVSSPVRSPSASLPLSAAATAAAAGAFAARP